MYIFDLPSKHNILSPAAPIFYALLSFANRNHPEKRVWELLSEKELGELQHNSPNVFKKWNIYRYMERPSITFCNEK